MRIKRRFESSEISPGLQYGKCCVNRNKLGSAFKRTPRTSFQSCFFFCAELTTTRNVYLRVSVCNWAWLLYTIEPSRRGHISVHAAVPLSRTNCLITYSKTSVETDIIHDFTGLTCSVKSTFSVKMRRSVNSVVCTGFVNILRLRMHASRWILLIFLSTTSQQTNTRTSLLHFMSRY